MSNLLLDNEDLRILGKYDNVLSLNKLEEAFRILDEILVNLGDEGVRELLGGNRRDVEEVYDILLQEILNVLYGKAGNVDAKLGYFDHFTQSVEETLCVENLTYFITSKIPQFMLNWHHLEWGDMVQRYDKFNCIAT